MQDVWTRGSARALAVEHRQHGWFQICWRLKRLIRLLGAGRNIERDLCLFLAQYTKKENWEKCIAVHRELLEVRLTNSNERELALAKAVARYSLCKLTQPQGIEGKTQ